MEETANISAKPPHSSVPLPLDYIYSLQNVSVLTNALCYMVPKPDYLGANFKWFVTQAQIFFEFSRFQK